MHVYWQGREGIVCTSTYTLAMSGVVAVGKCMHTKQHSGDCSGRRVKASCCMYIGAALLEHSASQVWSTIMGAMMQTTRRYLGAKPQAGMAGMGP